MEIMKKGGLLFLGILLVALVRWFGINGIMQILLVSVACLLMILQIGFVLKRWANCGCEACEKSKEAQERAMLEKLLSCKPSKD